MKHFNTLKLSLFIIFGLLFSGVTIADTHTINAGSYYYTPANITIDVGDTVTWLNDGGLHNVNFITSSVTGNNYNNPESFISSPTTGPVLHTHVFTISGN